ncbi:hypothetical protein EJ06DRAFT_104428 [Trichodelitschia bisporula]|uniref:Uncharacterized protein n=1 Tax=Trichodelitschia bisporula TaxID=703511 RepID=A0A6G1HQM2_9PEZI|nr:hypothetical protein EJ06DRAFT_104428 [Trichodelitschia bisporula]
MGYLAHVIILRPQSALFLFNWAENSSRGRFRRHKVGSLVRRFAWGGRQMTSSAAWMDIRCMRCRRSLRVVQFMMRHTCRDELNITLAAGLGSTFPIL